MAAVLTTFGQGACVGAVYTGGNNANSPAFVLVPGVYAFATTGTFSSTNAGLSVLGPDNATYVPCFTALTAAGVQAPLYLAAGTYQFTGTSTAFNSSVSRIPI